MGQHVLATNLVVEQVEAERGFRLRLAIKLPLKSPDTFWCCQAHRQSPTLDLFKSTPEVRALPSTGITRPQRYYDPLRLPTGCASPRRWNSRSTPMGLPRCPHHLSDVPCPLPRRTGQGLLSAFFPIRTAFPGLGGSASATSLSRPAQASLALRPTGSLDRPRRPLSRGFSPASYPAIAARQLPALPTSIWVDPSSTGDPRLRGAPGRSRSGRA